MESERVKNGEAAALVNWLQTFKRHGRIEGTIIIMIIMDWMANKDNIASRK